MGQGTQLAHAEEARAEPAASDRRTAVGGRGLRQHAARGVILNSAFQLGLAGTGLAKRLVVAAFLTRAEFGVWGILMATLLTLTWLKEVGIVDKYVQQSEADQERAFQKAFTLELMLSTGFFALVTAALPLYALAYGAPEIVLPGIVLATAVPLTAFEAPIWIPYRRMEYLRQRLLASVDPLVSFAATVALAVAGLGYWALVLGVVIGSLAGAVVAVAASPYRLTLRLERSTVRDYARFSWPLAGFGLSNLLVVQGSMLVGNRAIGIAGIGVIALATTIASFAERVDEVVSQTIYPAVCAVADRREKLFEAFVKSNRLALMWGMPFGVGLALFASALVDHVFGSQWRPAGGVIAAYGLMAGFRQIGFNYSVFFRAVNDTRPMFVSAALNLATFALAGVPLILLFRLPGFALAFGVMTAVQVFVRGWYLSRLFEGFRLWPHILRSIAPSVPAAGAVLLTRTVPGSGAARSAAELALYAAVTIVSTLVLERDLIREVVSYLRRRSGAAVPA